MSGCVDIDACEENPCIGELATCVDLEANTTTFTNGPEDRICECPEGYEYSTASSNDIISCHVL